jgi:hypothetical protein
MNLDAIEKSFDDENTATRFTGSAVKIERSPLFRKAGGNLYFGCSPLIDLPA